MLIELYSSCAHSGLLIQEEAITLFSEKKVANAKNSDRMIRNDSWIGECETRYNLISLRYSLVATSL